MATKEIIFDSNVWIGYFNTDDSTHEQALKIFSKHAKDTVVVTEYVLLEVTTVLKQKIGASATNIFLKTLLQTATIKLLPSSQFFTETLALFLESEENNLSFIDMSLVYLSRDFLIITFDGKLSDALVR